MIKEVLPTAVLQRATACERKEVKHTLFHTIQQFNKKKSVFTTGCNGVNDKPRKCTIYPGLQQKSEAQYF